MNLHFPKWMSWENFYTVILKGLKVYAFYLAVLSVFRLFFILWMHTYIGASTTASDVLLALGRGSCLSMQTAACLTLVSLVPSLVAPLLGSVLMEMLNPDQQNKVDQAQTTARAGQAITDPFNTLAWQPGWDWSLYGPLVMHQLPVHEYTALQVKQAVVGRGKAAKEQVQHMVVHMLALSGTPQADAADGLAVALTHALRNHGLGAQLQQGGLKIKRGRFQW